MKTVAAIIVLLLAESFYAQTVWVKDADGNPISKATVTALVVYKSNEFWLEGEKEKVITAVTDSVGKVKLDGEFFLSKYDVKSVMLKVQSEKHEPFEITTTDHSKEKTFSYTVYLVLKNTKQEQEPKFVASEKTDNELDIYSSADIAKLLSINEADILQLILNGSIKGKKIGDKYFVSGSELRKYLNK